MIVHSYDVEKSIQYVLELNCIKLRNIATKQRAKIFERMHHEEENHYLTNNYHMPI